jgi:hypothetical protein
MFFQTTKNEGLELKNILPIYEEASDKSINLQIYNIFCSKNVLGCNKFLGPVNISVFPPWWAEVEKSLSSLSRIGFGRK